MVASLVNQGRARRFYYEEAKEVLNEDIEGEDKDTRRYSMRG